MIDGLRERIEREAKERKQKKSENLSNEEKKRQEEYEALKSLVLRTSVLWAIPVLFPFAFFFLVKTETNQETNGISFDFKSFFVGFLAWYASLALRLPVQMGLALNSIKTEKANYSVSDEIDGQEPMKKASLMGELKKMSDNVRDSKWEPPTPPELSLVQHDILCFMSGISDQLVKFFCLRYLLSQSTLGQREVIGTTMSFAASWSLLENIMSLVQLATRLSLLKRTDKRAESGKIMLARSMGTNTFGLRPFSSLLHAISFSILHLVACLFLLQGLVGTRDTLRTLVLCAAIQSSLVLFVRYSYRVLFLFDYKSFGFAVTEIVLLGASVAVGVQVIPSLLKL